MSFTDAEGNTSCINEKTGESRDNSDNPVNLNKDNSELLEEPGNVEPSCSSDDINTADTIGNTTQITNKNKGDLIEQKNAICPVENKYVRALSSRNSERCIDIPEEEIKLRWDDEDSVELGEKLMTSDLSKDLCESVNNEKPGEVLESNKSTKDDNVFSRKAEEKNCIPNLVTAQSELLAEPSVLVKNDHGINKPDIMLDIPGMLPDMDEELEGMTLEMFSDDEKEFNPVNVEDHRSEQNPEINAGMTEVLSPLQEDESDCRLEMSSDIDDDLPDNSCTLNTTKLVEAIENEMKLLSDTMSSIEENDCTESKSVNLGEISTHPAIDKLDFMTEIKDKHQSSDVTLSNNKQVEPSDNIPITEFSPTCSTITEKSNVLEPHPTLSEQREKDMNIKVSTIISNIEEEMQLLDSNEDMEFELQFQFELESKPENFKTTEVPAKVTADLNNPEEISISEVCTSEGENKNIDFDENALRQKEQDEIALAVKAIEQKNENALIQKEQDEIALAVKAIEEKNESYDLVPAVTLVNVNTADDMSEISVIDEDDQQSVSVVLDDDDDDESIEVHQQHEGSVSALVDESEVSIIHDSEDDELPVLVTDTDDISKEHYNQNASQLIEMQEIIVKESEKTLDVQNEIIDTECNKLPTSNTSEQDQCLTIKQVEIESEQEAVKSDITELETSSIQNMDNIKQDMPTDTPSVITEENKQGSSNSNSSVQVEDNNDDETTGEVEMDVKATLIDVINSNTDKTTISIENVNIKLPSTVPNANDVNDVTSLALEEEKDISGSEQNENSTVILDQEPEDIEPQPSTSTVDLDMNKDSSNDVPDSDTLGLLAESTRVMDDDDDDDEDFYQDDESNLMTAEHSEDSNHHSDEAQETQDVMETQEKEIIKHTESQNTDDSMVGRQNYSEQELDTPEQQEGGEEKFQFTISNVTNNVTNTETVNDIVESDTQLEANTVDSIELNTDTKEDREPVEQEKVNTETSNASISSDTTVEKTSKPEEPASKPTEKEDKSPKKILSLTISSQQTVWNFVDLEESSEDEIQMVQKPSEEPVTSTQTEPQPNVAQPAAETEPEKEIQHEPTPTHVTEDSPDPDVEMNVEATEDALFKGDDSQDVADDAASQSPNEEISRADEQKTTEQLDGLEVFTLDSDDDDTTEPTPPVEAPPSPTEQEPEPEVVSAPIFESEPAKRDFKCVNISCQYAPGVKFYEADSATIAYYDADKRRRTFVCDDCWQPVKDRNEDLMEGIRNFTPLLELDMTTLSLDLVEISDSDSEPEPDVNDNEKDKIGDEGAKFLEENLTNMINDTWVKYQMDSRLSDTESVLQMELRRLESESKEVQSFLNECQATTDKIRNELYASFPQEIRQVPTLMVYDTPEQQYCYIQPLVPQGRDGEAPAPTPTRMSKRRLEAAANAESMAKRPAIPLGYMPLDAMEQMEYRIADKEEKIDDDNVEVSVVNIISSEAAPPGLPLPGESVKPPLKVGMMVYAMRSTFSSWVKGKIIEIMPKGTQSLAFTTCKVKFEHRNSKNSVKTVVARCMAYFEPSSVRLTIGTRVIANFKDSKDNKEPPPQELKRESYFSGVVAEVPNPVNKYRYLIFFDDGYAQYVSHADTRLVCECASLVWEEVHPFSREFVREYLMAYPERPMVRLHPFQSLKTEWNGKWWSSRVVAVDASLAQVHFLANNRYEWIYRGSTRLAPLYLELQAAGRHRARPMPRAQAHSRANMPVVEYTRYDEHPNKTFDADKSQQHRQETDAVRQRAVARKSTGAAAAIVRQPPGANTNDNMDNITSRVVYYTPKNAVRPHKMVPHTCGPTCKRTDVLALKELRTYNPLAKPLLSGWERQIVRYKGQKAVVYRSPCGRRVRNMRELHRYLRVTVSELPVDLFDFSPTTHCLAEFVLNKCLIMKKDLSQGKENVPVPCVNYYDKTLPEFCVYNTERTPTAGVPLNLDPEFLCGCDCEDDCEDKSKCACWKLTLEGARTIGLEGDNVGYEYKRLPEPLPSGIYECNSRCKCKHTCLNRVAQHPLQLKLQIFKTLNRGWGIRALNDVPKGSFLCVYAGNLLTDATANLDGLNEGDEYLAELDYIEVVEQMKEGYEEDIPKELKKKGMDHRDNADDDTPDEDESSEDEGQEASKNELEDQDFEPATSVGIRVAQFSKRLRLRNRNKDENPNEEKKESEKEKEEVKKEGDRGSNDEDCITISDDDDVREPSSFAAAAGMGAKTFVSKYKSVRCLFGEDEACYIMDAKVQGNIGRYLNHSCSPNVFVQNVFVDTHDPRFPWVAFFALCHVRAGTELTWNYNYDVGSVPGKALYCYCGAENCRGRLL